MLYNLIVFMLIKLTKKQYDQHKNNQVHEKATVTRVKSGNADKIMAFLNRNPPYDQIQ